MPERVRRGLGLAALGDGDAQPEETRAQHHGFRLAEPRALSEEYASRIDWSVTPAEMCCAVVRAMTASGARP